MRLLKKANSDPDLQDLIWHTCAQSLETYVTDWCWALDQRLVGFDGLTGHVPFVPFPKQLELLRWIQAHVEANKDGLVEKSRDEGVSYLFAFAADWAWRFHPGFSCSFGSRKVELADKLDDPDSLLEKIRINLRWQPTWLKPRGFKMSIHGKHCLLVNPETGATITAEGGDEQGRGGRKTWRMLDEFASQPKAHRIRAAVSNTARSIFYVSSVRGMGNEFAKLRHSGTIDVFRLHWTEDPRKDLAWYEDQCERLDPVTVAQEIDIDYSASIEGAAIPGNWVLAAVRREPRPVELRHGHRRAGLDVADSGNNENVLVCRVGPTVIRLETWSGLNTTQTAHKAAELAEADDVDQMAFDSVGVGAGVSGTVESTARPYDLAIIPVNWGKPPTPGFIDDAPKLPNKERFLNQRAQFWWTVRRRFQKSWENATQGADWPDVDCIEIPNDQTLIAQLSVLQWEKTQNGKVKLESKAHAKGRGVKSPDRADALVLAFAEVAPFELLI